MGKKKRPPSFIGNASRALKEFTAALPGKPAPAPPKRMAAIALNRANLATSNASPEFLAKLASFSPETFKDALEGLEERERSYKKRSKELYGNLEDSKDAERE